MLSMIESNVLGVTYQAGCTLHGPSASSQRVFLLETVEKLLDKICIIKEARKIGTKVVIFFSNAMTT